MPLPRRSAVVALFAACVGCNRPPASPVAAPPPLTAPADAAVAVVTVNPKRQSLAWTIDQPGSVQAFEVTPVLAKLSGYVSKVHVDLGDSVKGPVGDKPGTLLAEVSIPELAQEGEQKAALVEQARAEAEQARQGAVVAGEQVKSAEAMVHEAVAARGRVMADMERWESELKRMQGLSGVIDSQTLAETRKQYQTATAARGEVEAKIASAEAASREAKAKRGRADADVKAAEARVKVAEAETARVKALLGYTQIRAPFDGVVTERHVHTGHFLMPTGGKPEPLFVLARLDTVRVFAEVPESVSAAAGVGAKATVRFPALDNREVSAVVTRTSGVLSSDSRTLRVEIDVPNPDGTIKPGLFAHIRIAAGSANTYVLPAAAVLFADETAYCFAVKDGKAVKLRVQTGRSSGGVMEVFGTRKADAATGPWTPIDGGELVVVGNLGALADGQPVSVK
ncbi:MAG: efflux RND transporter periplasmic adaptor subunit [Gemmataceae bacterium]